MTVTESQCSGQSPPLHASQLDMWDAQMGSPTAYSGNKILPIVISYSKSINRVGFKITRREVEVAVPQDKMFKLREVIEVIIKQVQGEVVLLYEDSISDAHFSRLMSRFGLLFFVL